MSSFTAVSGNVGSDENVTYKAEKGNASTKPAVNNGQIRVYQDGGLFTVSVVEGCTLNNVTLGSAMATSVTYVTDKTTTASSSKSIAANGTVSVDLTGGEKSITFTCTGTSKTSRLYVNSLSVTYTSSGTTTKKSADLSFSETTATATVGESFTAPTLTNPNNLTVSYTSSNTDVATVDASTGVVTINAAGTTTITASSDENDNYEAGSASYTLTVKNNVFGDGFTETFDSYAGKGGNDNVWNGSLGTDIIDATKADNSGWTFSYGYPANKCIRLGDGSDLGYAITPSIKLTGDATLTFKAASWNTKNEQGILYLTSTNAKLSQSTIELTKAAFKDYTVKITDVKGDVTIKFSGSPDNTATAKQKNRFFLDEVVVKQNGTPGLSSAELSFPEASYTTKLGETFTAPTLTNPHDLAITYSSSDETVATVTSDGTVTLVKAGTTTITASSAETDTYAAGSASYTLTVTPKLTGDGTEANPYTVADAIALNDASQLPTDSVYVKGIISTISGYSSNTITYYISDDGTTSSQLEVYKGKNLNNTNFSAETDLQTGWTVTVKGKLYFYNNKTLEINSGNYITSLKKADVNAPTISGPSAFFDKATVTITADEGCFITYTTDGSDPTSASDAITTDVNSTTIELSATTTVKAVAMNSDAEISKAAEQTFTKVDESSAISVANALTTADNTVVLVKGKVSRTDSYNSSYENITYHISDDGAASSELEVYRGLGLSGAKISSADDIARGDEVFVYGTLTSYKSTKEFAASSIILKQTKAEEKTSITAAGWATYVTARSVDFSKTSDVKAYTVAYSTTDDAITLTPVTAVPGNTAVVLKGNQGDYTFTTTTDAAAVSKNNLKFYTKATEVAKAKTVYILANNNGTVGFCPATVGSTVPAYKGYLSISGGTTAKNFFALDGTATGINSIAADKANGRDVRFNLAGQRVDKNYKGVVIVNGKKQLVK